jgi:hypothetical protein
MWDLTEPNAPMRRIDLRARQGSVIPRAPPVSIPGGTSDETSAASFSVLSTQLTPAILHVDASHSLDSHSPSAAGVCVLLISVLRAISHQLRCPSPYCYRQKHYHGYIKYAYKTNSVALSPQAKYTD